MRSKFKVTFMNLKIIQLGWRRKYRLVIHIPQRCAVSQIHLKMGSRLEFIHKRNRKFED
jgi:hypothetical protein